MPICKHEEFLSLINFKNRILGFDHGTKKIGVAISDENLTLASPLKTIIRKKKINDLNEVFGLISDYSIKGIVFGWPLNMNGSKGPRCQSVETFINNLLNINDIPILLQDERMSTQAVEKIWIEQNVSRKKRSDNIDKHAACWILQSALDTLKKK